MLSPASSVRWAASSRNIIPVHPGGLKRNQNSENRAVRAHDLATDDLERDQAPREQAIMEVGQRKVIAHLLAVIAVPLPDCKRFFPLESERETYIDRVQLDELDVGADKCIAFYVRAPSNRTAPLMCQSVQFETS